MRIINIVDNLNKVNYGIWSAAIATASHLFYRHNVVSELWYPKPLDPLSGDFFRDVQLKEIDPLHLCVPEMDNETIIVTHGVWRYPTRWGDKLRQKGFPWVYVPHGMLEPWGMEQKRLKKFIYFHFVEKQLAGKASVIRAVGKPEQDNLSKIFSNVVLIPNGIEIIENIQKEWSQPMRRYLFMARLHHKKGVLPLVKAWKQSVLSNCSDTELVIAGPDHGELTLLENEICQGSNIRYVGPVYGPDKEKLLRESHFYVLPSFSEGFPTSIVEAMAFGLIPLISHGCNFPEAFSANMAIQAEPTISSINEALVQSTQIPADTLLTWSKHAKEFVAHNYSLQLLADKQYELYSSILK
jgi:glycosyltransferase involved in cell wall biosynthesis